jgi:hypothetical protein
VWALVGLAMVELMAVHLFVALKWPWLAWPLSAISLLSILWFVWLIRSFRSCPHELEGETLHLRAGRLRSVALPCTAIATVRGVRDGDEVKADDTVNLALISYPNRIIELHEPISVRGKRKRRIALALDDPAAFDLALRP